MHEERIPSTATDKISTVTFLKPYSNIFAPVCHSVHRGESASVHAGIPPKETRRQGDPPPLPRRPPAKETPPTAKETPPTTTAAGGTHPTGMHSCYYVIQSTSRSSQWQN